MDNVILHVKTGIHCHNLPEGIKDKVREQLTFANKKYDDDITNRGFTAEEPFFYFYSEDESIRSMYVPRGYFYYIKSHLKKAGIIPKVVDDTLTFDKIDIEFQGDLRDYQDEAVYAMAHYPNGVLEAATGSGKTVMGCGMIAVRKQPTLVIVHNKELLYQWRDAIKQFLGYTPGLYGDGKSDMKEITVGIINTVRNNIDDLYDQFGMIIIDETHRCPSKTWTETLTYFEAKYTLGLSATPFRRDGLGKAIKAFIGPALFKVDLDRLEKEGAILRPNIYRINTNFFAGFNVPYPTIIKNLTENIARNDLIARTTRNDLEAYGEAVLIVTDRVEHCKLIQKSLKKYFVKSDILHGKLPTSERASIVNRIKSGKSKVIIATISLIGEGFDCPNLSALLMTTPVKFSGRILQTIGRVLRPKEGKEPRVYDFRDNKVPVLLSSGNSRDKVYDKQWGN